MEKTVTLFKTKFTYLKNNLLKRCREVYQKETMLM